MFLQVAKPGLALDNPVLFRGKHEDEKYLTVCELQKSF